MLPHIEKDTHTIVKMGPIYLVPSKGSNKDAKQDIVP